MELKRLDGTVIVSDDAIDNLQALIKKHLESSRDLTRANLRVANLYGADLSGANLSGAELYGAKGVSKYMTTPMYFIQFQPGKQYLFKLVDNDMWSPINGNRIHYEIGKTAKADEINLDETEQCGAGISLASLDWCLKEYRDGYRILLCSLNYSPETCCIPIGSDGKIRVKSCKVERDITDEVIGKKEAQCD
jgi:hypothetical protein